VGRILFETVRASDCLARYGGEEFVVILPHTDRGGALALSDRFRANIEAHEWTLRGITASIGISSMSVSHSDAQALIVDADRALYRAKTAGRNCVVHAADISSVAGS
jgi:diguanylate cyclase (GGDEF)-like protein